MRISIIDGFRGFFLINMTIVHLNYMFDSLTFKFNHHKLGWVEDAQGFVLLSGFVIGLVFGKSIIKNDYNKTKLKILSRARTLFIYNSILILFITFLVLIFPTRGDELDSSWGNNPFIYSIISLLLINGPKYIDILPMYIVFMTITPFVLYCLHRGLYIEVLATSFAVWVFAQTGLVDTFLHYISTLSGLSSVNIELGMPFNRLGWQILYFFGLAAGMKMAEGKLDLSFLHGDLGYRLFLLCVALIAVFLATRIEAILYSAEMEGELSTTIAILYERSALSPLRLLNFVVDVYAVCWLLIAGQRVAWTRPFSRLLSAVMNWPPLVYLGKHSLQIYAFHVFIYYVAAFFLYDLFGEMGEIGRATIILTCVLSLYIPALLHDTLKARHRSATRNS